MHVNYLPTWNLKPRITKNTGSAFVSPPQGKKGTSETEMSGASSDFKKIKMEVNSRIEQCTN